MREIKFRIYNKEDNKMEESGGTPSMLEMFFKRTAVLNTRDKMPYQQFTGLTDRNGVEIYEGDIVIEDGDHFTAETVEFGIQNVDAFMGVGFNLWPFMNDPDYRGNHNSKNSALQQYEVIGNIYQNLELLQHDN